MDKKTRLALNRLAREETKMKLLNDIMFDIQVCQLENWDYKEYLKELVELVSEFIKED